MPNESNDRNSAPTQNNGSRPRQPWHRQPGESPAAYRAFCLYRDFGPERSLRKAWLAASETKPKKRATPEQRPSNKKAYVPGRWTAWSSEHSWRSRVEAYDEQVQCPEYQFELRRAERRRYAQAAYEDILNRLIDNLGTELPYLLFTPRVTTKMDGSKVTTRAVSPTAIATLLREIRQFEYVVQNGFDSKPRGADFSLRGASAPLQEDAATELSPRHDSTPTLDDNSPIDMKHLAASLITQLREHVTRPANLDTQSASRAIHPPIPPIHPNPPDSR